jgi:arsenate reductase (thioredoxin)
MPIHKQHTLLHLLAEKVNQLILRFNQIPPGRKAVLNQLALFIQSQQQAGNAIILTFICTHNSRRSHIAQLWAQTAAYYYGIQDVSCFSGGTEATAFNVRAVKAMQDAGFDITKTKDGSNPIYEVRFADGQKPVVIFSKKFDDPSNPGKGFAAIMTCSHADENCPLVPGASARIALTYDDPKDFDGTPQEAEQYAQRVHEIGTEIFYAFSQVKV